MAETAKQMGDHTMAGYTLITGASEGLGVEFARLAARDGRNMILTARSEHKLNALAQDLRKDGLDVAVITADLSDPAAADRLWSQAVDGRQIDMLVNNAGLGHNGAFANADGWTRELASLQVNVMAFTRLMKCAAMHMAAHGEGRILNVSSLAGFMPGPNMAVYHAGKAFALSLSEAVAEELHGTGVTVTALCPGPTSTNFFADADMGNVRLVRMGRAMRAFDVAELGWLEARIGKRIVVPGFQNKLQAFGTRLMPRSMVTRIARLVLGRS